jgi:hypothetical protein
LGGGQVEACGKETCEICRTEEVEEEENQTLTLALMIA